MHADKHGGAILADGSTIVLNIKGVMSFIDNECYNCGFVYASIAFLPAVQSNTTLQLILERHFKYQQLLWDNSLELYHFTFTVHCRFINSYQLQ